VGSDFNRLVAYRRAVEIAQELHGIVQGWSAYDKNTIGVQMIRAIDSVGANIAEAMGRWTKADRRRFLLIARGSLYETEHWINAATSRGLISKDFSGQLAEAGRTLNGLVKKSL
jgi:four helix bundle protein